MNLLPVLGAVLVLAFFSGSHSLFYLAYVLGGLLLVSRLGIPRVLKGVESQRRFPARGFFGEDVSVELEVANSGRWPIPWLSLHESLPLALHVPNFERRVVSLAGGERVTLRYTLHCLRRGHYHLGPLALETGDLFGLAPDQRKERPEDVFIVYPKIVPLPLLGLPSQIPFGDLQTQTRFFEDPTRFFGVRDYQPGDSLRRIDWRSSAHLARLQVKRFQPAVALHGVVFLDLNREAYSLRSRAGAEDLGCTIAASVVARLLDLRQQVGLAVLSSDEVTGFCGLQSLPVSRGRQHMMRLLETLARARMAVTDPLTAVLPQASTNLGWGSTLVVITAGDCPSLVEVLLQMRRRGFRVLLVATDPEKRFLDLKARLDQIGVRAFWITSERDLDVWR